jgi:uncharacterized BrkB/YihY/UPF0761 family membrane protein
MGTLRPHDDAGKRRATLASSVRPGARWADRGRAFRTLTFWLRPAFALRVVGRFQTIAGFDRAIALASSALTALIPLTMVAGAIVTHFGGKDTAQRIISRYELSGSGAEAVKDVFSPAGGAEVSVGVLGTLLLLIAVLSFTRAVQRLFEQTWELPPLSVRNTLNGLRWILVLMVYFAITGVIQALLDVGRVELLAGLVTAPFTAGFLMLSGWVLSAKRITPQALLPFALIGAVLLTIYGIGATVYVPHLFSSYAARYGAIGAVFAMISTLFCVMVVVVGAAALGREVRDELDRIRDGKRPPDDEIRQEWDTIIATARLRWQDVRERYERRRHGGETAAAAKEQPTQEEA